MTAAIRPLMPASTAVARVGALTDLKGTPVDPEIASLVAGCYRFGISTYASCAGHADKWAGYPFLDIAAESSASFWRVVAAYALNECFAPFVTEPYRRTPPEYGLPFDRLLPLIVRDGGQQYPAAWLWDRPALLPYRDAWLRKYRPAQHRQILTWRYSIPQAVRETHLDAWHQRLEMAGAVLLAA